MTDFTINDVYAGLNQFKDYINTVLPFKLTAVTGTVNPITAGYTANIPTLYIQVDVVGPSAVLQNVYIKIGPLDTDWQVFGSGGSSVGRWHFGTGAPSGGLGSDQDWYFDDTSRKVYYKSGGSWAEQILGAQWYTGTAVPGVGIGVDGNWYLRTGGANEIYLKSGGAWAIALAGGGGSGVVTTNQLKTIGSGGDYTSFQDFMTNYYTKNGYAPGVTVVARFLATYSLTLVDQYVFIDGDFSNLIIDTEGASPLPVDTTGFIPNSFGIVALFSAVNSTLGQMNALLNCTANPTNSAGLSLAGTARLINIANPFLPAPRPFQLIGFSPAISALQGANGMYVGVIDSVIAAYQSELVSITSDHGGALSLTEAVIRAESGSEIFLDQGTISANDAGTYLVDARSGAEIYLSNMTVNPTNNPAARTNAIFRAERVGTKLSIDSGSFTIDQSLLFGYPVYSIAEKAKLEASNFAITILNPTAGSQFLNISDGATAQFFNTSITTSDWPNPCNVPIGQVFADGSGVFGLSVDGSTVGFQSVILSEAGSYARPAFCSELTLTGANVDVFNLSNVGSLPVGAKILVRISGGVINHLVTDAGTFDWISDGDNLIFEQTSTSVRVYRSNLVNPANLVVVLPEGSNIRTISATDHGKTIVFNSWSSCTLYLTDVGGGAFPLGGWVNFRNASSGSITITVTALLCCKVQVLLRLIQTKLLQFT